MLTVQNSYYFSLFVQLISLIIFSMTFSVATSPNLVLVKNAYYIEYVVSIIEFIGYVILGFYLNSKVNITAIRYGDWFITTNMLLVSLSLFLLYNRLREEGKSSQLPMYTFQQIKQEHAPLFLKIMSLNTLMLVFGFLGELQYLNKFVSLSIGLLFFAGSFKLIYDHFVGNVLYNQAFFCVFSFVWLLYAAAFLLPYENKNIAYNLLDLVSKNLFGIFLFFFLYTA